MIVNVYAASGRPRADQPLYVEHGRLLGSVAWAPDEELMCEALELFGFGIRRWIELVGGRDFYSYDDNGDVELIAEVVSNE
jgi:hypothetical protein